MKIVAKTLFGLEKVLAQELTDLGASDVKPANRAVSFSGDRALLYRVNYCSRTAISVLMHVSDFRIRVKEDLYKGGIRIEWDRYLGPGDTFSVVPVVNSGIFSHTGYPGLILKDAVADYFRKKYGRRPSVNTGDPSVLINLHISNDHVTVSLDSSVIPLFKRGYRISPALAPLNEVLAAGILLLSGWNASCPLTDPMCGSGTIPIEAGLLACNIPPGRQRSFFGFERWKDYDPELFIRIRDEAELKIVSSPVKISGSDISGAAVDHSEINVRKAGLADVISLRKADLSELKSAGGQEFLFMNPPYGQRIKPVEIDNLYGMIGSVLKHSFPQATAWIISSNRESVRHIGLRPAEKHILFNGALECLLVKYEMYTGTRKHKGH